MKRKIALLSAIALVGGCLMTGCDSTQVTEIDVPNEPANVNMADETEEPIISSDNTEDVEETSSVTSLESLDKQLAEEAAKLPSSPEEFAKSIPQVEPLGAKSGYDLSKIDEYIDFHLPADATEEQCQQFSAYVLWATLNYDTTLGNDLSGLYDIITTFNDLCQKCIDYKVPLTEDGLIFENYKRAVKALENSWEYYDLSKSNSLYGKKDVIDDFHNTCNEYRDWVNEQKKAIRESH